MPIALKEWAVTVRALAEGEQLLTLRKGGIREEHKHFELEHDRFFLYPTFDHQRNDVVREAHMPELRRALEEGVWPDGDPPTRALTRDGGIPQPDRVRVRAWAEVAGHFRVTAASPGLLLGFDVATWLRDLDLAGATPGGDGVIRVDTEHDPLRLAAFEAALARGAELFRDTNQNGEVDGPEDALLARGTVITP